MIEIFGQVRQESSLPTLLKLVAEESDGTVISAALVSLISYENEKIPTTVLERYSKFSHKLGLSLNRCWPVENPGPVPGCNR